MSGLYPLSSYSERDLNPHNRYGHKILSLACLPFHHPSRPGAKDGTRTRDPDLGKVVLYQLSYFRDILFSKIFQSVFHRHLAKVGFTFLFGARSCSTHPELLSQYTIFKDLSIRFSPSPCQGRFHFPFWGKVVLYPS